MSLEKQMHEFTLQNLNKLYILFIQTYLLPNMMKPYPSELNVLMSMNFSAEVYKYLTKILANSLINKEKQNLVKKNQNFIKDQTETYDSNNSVERCNNIKHVKENIVRYPILKRTLTYKEGQLLPTKSDHLHMKQEPSKKYEFNNSRNREEVDKSQDKNQSDQKETRQQLVHIVKQPYKPVYDNANEKLSSIVENLLWVFQQNQKKIDRYQSITNSLGQDEQDGNVIKDYNRIGP